MTVEQIKEITSDNKIDASEIKKLDENLSKPENQKALKEALNQSDKEDVLKLSNSIINHFKNNLNIISSDSESKKSFINVIGFIISSYDISKMNKETKTELSGLKNNLMNPSGWIRENIAKDPKFFEDKIFPLLSVADTDANTVKQIEGSFAEQLKTIRITQINNNIDSKQGYFDNIVSALIEKKYSKQLSDINFISYVKNNFLKGLDQDNITKIKNEMKSEITLKGSNQIKDIYNNNYNVISPFSENLDKFKSKSELLEGEYKTNIIKSKMEKIMEEELTKFLSDSEDIKTTREDFLQYIQKKVDKYDLSEIRSKYNTVNDESRFGAGFRTEIGEHLGEEIAEINREDIKKELKTFESSGYMGDKNLIRTFEDMLEETSAKNINNMAYILAKFPDQKNMHIENILDKISKKKIENCKMFSNVKISSFVEESSIQDFKTNIQKSEKSTNYKNILKQEKSEYFDESNMASLFLKYNQNPSIKKITISIPQGKDDIYAGIQKQINLLANGNQDIINKFDIKQIGGINNIKISTLENKETKGSIELALQKLDANMIGEPAKIEQLLSNNPQMKEFIDNPNYTLNGGEILGTASKNRTNYQQKFSDSENQGIKIIKERNNSQLKEEDTNLTNNPGLAYDRAYSFLDYFLRTKNVNNQKEPEFKIKYNVDGPTREELTASLKEKNEGKSPSNQEILDAFKEYQNANIKLDFTKNEKIIDNVDIDIQEKQLVQGLEVNIVGDVPSGAGWKPTFPRLGLRIGGGRSLNLDPGRFNRCATFN